MANKNPQKIPKYFCSQCQYITANKKDFSKHIATLKHLKMVEMLINANEKSPHHNFPESDETVTISDHNCFKCHRKYKHLASLCRHKKNCISKCSLYISNDNTSEIVVELIKQSKELQNLLLEQNKQIFELSKTQSVTNNITNNNINQQFNLQLFLNETCKYAMNLMDFVNSLQLKIEDFEETGKLGYIEGISRIIINGLKKVDTTKRPIHCTDIKRETLYIKNDDLWEKEEHSKINLKRAVNQVARMNLSQLPKWQKENPASEVLDTKENGEYIKYSMAALGGNNDEEEEFFVNKIMKNVMREVVIDKKII